MKKTLKLFNLGLLISVFCLSVSFPLLSFSQQQWVSSLTSSIGSNHTANSACLAGYTRVGLWCIDTDGGFSTLRVSTVNEASYTTSAAPAGSVLLLLQAVVVLGQDVTADDAQLEGCALPNDSAIAECNSGGGSGSIAYTRAVAANETSVSIGTAMVRVAAGNVKTRCNLATGVVGSLSCRFMTMGYMD